MKVVSPIEGIEINPLRRSGNTTRAVDRAIQLLFKGETVIVRDPWLGGTKKECNEYLLRRIIDRLFNEHKIDKHAFELGWHEGEGGKERTISLKHAYTGWEDRANHELTDFVLKQKER